MISDFSTPDPDPHSSPCFVNYLCSTCLRTFFTYRRKSKYLSIPENNGHETPKGPSAIIFQEWTDTRTFSYLKYTLIYNYI